MRTTRCSTRSSCRKSRRSPIIEPRWPRSTDARAPLGLARRQAGTHRQRRQEDDRRCRGKPVQGQDGIEARLERAYLLARRAIRGVPARGRVQAGSPARPGADPDRALHARDRRRQGADGGGRAAGAGGGAAQFRHRGGDRPHLAGGPRARQAREGHGQRGSHDRAHQRAGGVAPRAASADACASRQRQRQPSPVTASSGCRVSRAAARLPPAGRRARPASPPPRASSG